MKIFAVSDYTMHEGYFFDSLENATDYAKKYSTEDDIQIVEMDLQDSGMFKEVDRYTFDGQPLEQNEPTHEGDG